MVCLGQRKGHHLGACTKWGQLLVTPNSWGSFFCLLHHSDFRLLVLDPFHKDAVSGSSPTLQHFTFRPLSRQRWNHGLIWFHHHQHFAILFHTSFFKAISCLAFKSYLKYSQSLSEELIIMTVVKLIWLFFWSATCVVRLWFIFGFLSLTWGWVAACLTAPSRDPFPSNT